jgi:chaperonin GroEL
METVSPAEQGILRKRLAALLGGITVIKVGGVTVTEMEEKKDRVIDAMSAAKAAVESGIVPGGGIALLRASDVLAGLDTTPEEWKGVEVIYEACRAVTKQIATNAGLNSDMILTQLMATPNLGYNALTNSFEDLVESGIIDPAKVVVESLRNAAAVACSIITMGATVSELKQERPTNA